jgi:hypothetical protein
VFDQPLERPAVHLGLTNLNHVDTGTRRRADSIEQDSLISVPSNLRRDQATHRAHAREY